uniref:HD domain-containing protein n=2 Tax=Oryza meridionalis TaxID=40149 RepID=A0A0E0EZ50_9ORYZ
MTTAATAVAPESSRHGWEEVDDGGNNGSGSRALPPWRWSTTVAMTVVEDDVGEVVDDCAGETDWREVEIAALLHDIGDYKYTKDNAEDMSIVERFLEEVELEQGQREEIVAIIKGMGFKNEVSKKSVVEPTLEFAIVQDADRLDAIGIARCFTYGGSKKNTLHDPKILPRDNLSKEKYMSKDEKQTSINHFHEKLFKLKDMMKTEAGKKRAEKRHKFMEDFVAEFYEEWSGRA